MTRVLIVEDDAGIARALAVNLRARGYEVTHAASGRAAILAASDAHPDVVLLDLGLPDLDGRAVIDAIRGWSQVPIVVVSARSATAAKIDALDAGADDFVTKPFAMDELLARLRAAVRRAPVDHDAAPEITTADGRLTVDLANDQVRIHGEPVRLTPTELRIVEVLARAANSLVSRTELLRAVWGPEYERETNYLRVYLSQIRQKLEVNPSEPRYFLTELGMGYRFVTAAPEPSPDNMDEIAR